ncbi:FAD/NAD(P)-binding domain-containing protein [Hypoxylon rubiginosum]|uniref:FAD/NAD(P)-binding domain-containing protein n=1 Tax=Hypoxylon rubiginosum TaxID=110542 RepID=A0ACC0D653_9PEZI|nr:FAD/NAD(P)-binding domain-containing protein [Hypoxylon rubiginosum]
MDPLRENAIYNERFVKVICVGAGASGILLAYRLKRSFNNYSLTIYDKNPEISGTWFENRYPGCACDVPSHNYTYSFEPKPDFSSVYAGSKEIKGYFQEFVAKYDLQQFIKTSHLVTETKWSEEKGQWEVRVEDVLTGKVIHDWCHILIHATGYLNKPAWPKIPGIEKYKGTKLHSADYDESISLEGKDVLLIGAGSSAVQILPAIQPIVKRAKIFIRSPVWVLPDISSESGKYSLEQIEKFVKDPRAVLELRQNNERTMNSIFTMYMKDTILQEQCKNLLTTTTKKLLQDEEMERHLIPDFAVGCKRVIPSGYKYLTTLKKENIDVVYSGVTSFTEDGCISDDGQSHKGDVIICATGFNTSYVPSYPVLADGRNLQEEWRESIMGYMGVGISEFPNTLTFLGPYTPVSNGPTLIAIEAQADYICSFIDRYQTEPSMHSFRPKRAACEDFKAHVASAMERLVWTDRCRNSHNNHAVGGRVPTTWPGSTLHYLEAVREPRVEDWEFGYRGNRFAWLGDGVSQTEWDPTSDLGYYIRDADDGKSDSRRARTLAIARTGTQPARPLHRQPKLTIAEEKPKVATHEIPVNGVSAKADKVNGTLVNGLHNS